MSIKDDEKFMLAVIWTVVVAIVAVTFLGGRCVARQSEADRAAYEACVEKADDPRDCEAVGP